MAPNSDPIQRDAKKALFLRLTFLVLASSFWGGCRTLEVDPAHDRSAIALAELRARALRSAPMVRQAGQNGWSPALGFEVRRDSATWRDEDGSRMAIHVRRLEAVRFNRTWAASLTGAAAGASAGALLGYAAAEGDDWWREGEVYAGAALGAVLGAAAGRFIGFPVTYRFSAR